MTLFYPDCSNNYWATIQQWCAANDLPLIDYHDVTTDDPASQART